MFHTFLVGSSGRGRSLWMEALLNALPSSLSLWGYRTPKEAADGTGRAPIPETFERCAGLIERAGPGGLLLLDELGPMESRSPRFCQAVLNALDGDTPILAWVRDMDTPLLSAVRSHPRARCFYPPPELSPALFDQVAIFLAEQI